MKHAELLKLVGKNVRILFCDGTWIWGKLGYAYKFSAEYDYRKANYFFIGDTSFKASHVKKVAESEGE